MRAAVFHGPGDVRVTHLPDPVPGPGEVVVRVRRAGICGSDVNRYRRGSHPWAPGFILGHEFCGAVAALGPGVEGWPIGQPVVVEPTLSCDSCFYCRDGHPNRCVEFLRRGLTGSGSDGGFAEYAKVPAYQLHDWPPGMSAEVASLAEPTAVSVHGWRLAGLERPDSVVVVGIGNIGLLAVLVARAQGAGRVIAVGKYAPRQALARAYGADLVVEPDDPRLVERVQEATGGLGAALVLEAAGSPGSLRMALATARKGARIVILGVFHDEVSLDYKAILMNEQTLIGSLIYRRADFAEALATLGRSPVDPARHVTRLIPLADIVAQGFVPLMEQPAAHIKVQIDPA